MRFWLIFSCWNLPTCCLKDFFLPPTVDIVLGKRALKPTTPKQISIILYCKQMHKQIYKNKQKKFTLVLFLKFLLIVLNIFQWVQKKRQNSYLWYNPRVKTIK